MSSQAAADLKRPSCIIVMQAGRPVCAEPAYPIKLSLHAGNSTERLASCSNTTLPQSFTQYLNTSFLGERQFMQVGPVNYTFFQFGPLGSTIVGTYHISSSQIIFLPLFFVLLAYRPRHPGAKIIALHCVAMACTTYWSHVRADNRKANSFLLFHHTQCACGKMPLVMVPNPLLGTCNQGLS